MGVRGSVGMGVRGSIGMGVGGGIAMGVGEGTVVSVGESSMGIRESIGIWGYVVGCDDFSLPALTMGSLGLSYSGKVLLLGCFDLWGVFNWSRSNKVEYWSLEVKDWGFEVEDWSFEIGFRSDWEVVGDDTEAIVVSDVVSEDLLSFSIDVAVASSDGSGVVPHGVVGLVVLGVPISCRAKLILRVVLAGVSWSIARVNSAVCVRGSISMVVGAGIAVMVGSSGIAVVVRCSGIRSSQISWLGEGTSQESSEEDHSVHAEVS